MKDSGFPPTYSGGRSEYHPSVRENTSISELEQHQRSNQDKAHDFATEGRKRALDKLEKSIQQGPDEELPMQLAYPVIVIKGGNVAFMSRDGKITGQADIDQPAADKLCAKAPHLFMSVPIPDYVRHPSGTKCWCSLWSSREEGLGVKPHPHCTPVALWWPW
jgi:hypothetical protein